MKRIFCILITLILIFGSILPVFAASESIVTSFANPSLSNQVSAYQVMMTLVNFVTSFSTDWGNWTNLLGDGNSPGTYYSFQDLAQEVHGLWYWLTPRNPDNISATGLGLWDYIWYIAQEVSSMWGGWDSYFSNLTSLPVANNFLGSLNNALSNINPGGHAMTIGEIQRNAHRSFVSELSEYSIDFFNKATGVVSSNTYNWQAGSPLGNIALILQKLNQNTVNIAEAFLKNYNDTLTTWEHSTNTQTSFSPTSLTNGLYRYLAYIQSDTGQGYYSMFNNMVSDMVYYTGDTRRTYPITSLTTMLYRFGQMNHNYLHATGSYQSFLLGQLSLYRGTDLAYRTPGYYSTDDLLKYGFENLSQSLSRLAFVHADDNDIAAKRGTQANEQTITNNFLSTSGSAAASASDYGALASASGSFKQNFNTGASASGIFDLFSGDHASSWFSQETANQLDSNNAVRSVKGGVRTVIVSEYDTPLLDSYYSDIMSIFNKKSDDYSEYVNYIDESIYPAQGVQEEGVILD